MVMKILMVFKVVDTKNKAKAVLGQDAYLRVFQQSKGSEEEKKKFTKIINGEVVGKELPSSKSASSEATMEPEMCPHPAKKMVRRGNKNSQWWTCTQCMTRWERLPLESLEPKAATTKDTDLVTFGQYEGKTYLEVFQDPTHAQYVLMTAEQDPKASPAVKRLARYLVEKERSATWEEVPIQHDQMDEDSFDL